MRFLYLHTREITDLLPEAQVTDLWDAGCNIQVPAVDAKVLSRFHNKGQVVGLWVSAEEAPKEGPEYWRHIFSLGADMICTDRPLEALLEYQKFTKDQTLLSEIISPAKL